MTEYEAFRVLVQQHIDMLQSDEAPRDGLEWVVSKEAKDCAARLLQGTLDWLEENRDTKEKEG